MPPPAAVPHESELRETYDAFNVRDVDRVLSHVLPDVEWANGMEGGVLKGHLGVRANWKRQWKRIDSRVTPLSFRAEADGRIRVEVHQTVRDISGTLILDRTVFHVYRFEGPHVAQMEIRTAPER